MNKFFIITIILILINGCSYQPIFSNKEYDFKFVNINFEGDKKINNNIKSKLTSETDDGKKYDIFFTSRKEKEIVSSNEKGDPKIYKLKIYVEYSLEENGKKIFDDIIIEQVNYNNMTDKFKLSQYETNIINDLSNNIASRIIVTVATLKLNK